MPVQVKCPGCNSELTASDEMVGQMASCPQCKSQFPVTHGRPKTAPATPPPPPGDAPRRPGVVPAGLKKVKGQSAASAPLPNPAEPPTVPSPVPSPAPSAVSSPVSSPGPASPPVQPTRKTKQRRRRPKQAKFITADATQTTIHLGADGQLPELVLREADAKEKDEEVSSSGTSPLLIVALAVSVVFSVILLLVDLSGSRGESRTRQDARESLEANYIGKDSDTSELEPYQLLIRQALQEHSSGNPKAERKLYKQVLDILHAERKNEYAAVTGRLTGSPPSDEHLEDLINTLRRE